MTWRSRCRLVLKWRIHAQRHKKVLQVYVDWCTQFWRNSWNFLYILYYIYRWKINNTSNWKRLSAGFHREGWKPKRTTSSIIQDKVTLKTEHFNHNYSPEFKRYIHRAIISTWVTHFRVKVTAKTDEKYPILRSFLTEKGTILNMKNLMCGWMILPYNDVMKLR